MRGVHVVKFAANYKNLNDVGQIDRFLIKLWTNMNLGIMQKLTVVTMFVFLLILRKLYDWSIKFNRKFMAI